MPSISQTRSIAFILEVPVGWLVGDAALEPYASAEYFHNVTRAKQMIVEQRGNPSDFLFGENRPVAKETIISWVTDKMGLPGDNFEFKDIMPASPDATCFHHEKERIKHHGNQLTSSKGDERIAARGPHPWMTRLGKGEPAAVSFSLETRYPLGVENERRLLLRMIQIALFIALCFVGTSIAIPFGASKVHLGNLVCLLASLLCDPLVGALSGALGMGIHDVMMGYAYTTYLRTFLLKFLMGFILGHLFRLLLKKKANGDLLLCLGALLSATLFAFSLAVYFTDYREGVSLVLTILSSVVFALFLLGLCLIKKLDRPLKILLFSLLFALSVNVAGEFFLRYAIQLLLGMESAQALALSYAKLPAALLTSIASILGALFLFYPLYFSTRRFNSLDDLGEYVGASAKEARDGKRNP